MTRTEKALETRRRNRMNRRQGAEFEKMIEAACDFYRARSVADVEKTPEAMKPIKKLERGQFLAVYTKKAQADFKGFLMGGRAVAFEAKHTDTGRLDQDKVTEEQTARLERAWAYGCHTFVLCSFSDRAFFRVPWNIWRDMKALFGHKYITPQEAAPWAIRFGGPGVLLFLEGLEDKQC